MQNRQVLSKEVTVAGGGGNTDRYIPVPGVGRWRVTDIVFTPETAVALHATNYWTCALQATDGEAGTPGTAMASWSTATGDTVHVVNDKIQPTITDSNAEVVGGGSILVNIDEAGTAATAFDGSFSVVVEKMTIT